MKSPFDFMKNAKLIDLSGEKIYFNISYFKRVWLYLPSLSGRNGRHLTWKAKHWWSLPFTKPTYWVWSKVKVTCNHCGEDAGS